MIAKLLKNKVLLVLFVSILGLGFVQAQERTISGKVTDQQMGETLIGVNVTHANDPSKGTVTDIDGNYQITVPEGVTALSFSYVGYTSQVIEITADIINVKMVAGEQLEEVVVIGYGSQSAKEVTGAVTSVKAEDFNQGNINDPVQLIQGKVAGLSIAKPGNDPNQSYNIRLRGLSTFGASTEPLIIIDGVQGADLNSVDPDDIASMDVLKDASATSIYGTQGASGVIIITTKKGEFVSEGKSFNVNFSAALTTESGSRKLDVLSPEDFRSFPSAIDYDTINHSSTDWMNELTQQSISQAYNLSIDGATKTSNYRVSFNYRKADGVVIGTGFERINGRLNFSQKALQDKLTFDFNLAATNQTDTYSPSEAFGAAVKYNPTAPVFADDDYSQEWGGYFQRDAFAFNNPRAMIDQSTMDGKKLNIMGSLRATLEIIEGLKLSGSYSQNHDADVYGSYWSKNAYNMNSHKGFGDKSNNNTFSHLFESILSYEKEINGFKVKGLAGYSFREDYFDNLWVHGEGFLSDEFSYNNLGSASEDRPNDESFGTYKESSRLIGFFGRASVNWRETAFVTANFRRDGSSKFGDNNKWGNFGGVSAGVDFAKLFELDFVDRLKLRGGYGTVGNLPADSYLSKNNYGKVSDEFFYNGEFIQAYAPSVSQNKDLKWEVKKEMNIGIDFFILNYRIGGSVDYYRSISSDLIMYSRVPMPPNDAEFKWINLGELENSGLEFSINIRAIEKKDFSWSTDLNFTKYFDTKIIKITSPLVEAESIQYYGYLGAPYYTGMATIIAAEGESIGQIIAPVYVGLDSTGAMLYQITDDSTSTGPIDRLYYQNVGNGLPKFQFGWNNSFKYKNLDINFFIRGVFGHYLVNVNNARYGNPTTINIQGGMNMAKEYQGTTGYSYADIHVEKADFITLDNFSIGYNFLFPESKYVGKARVFVSGQNLFTITNYSGVSPEVRYDDGGNPLAPGIDRENTYFTTRSFTFGVNVNF